MHVGTGNASEDAASEVLQRRRQGDGVAREEVGAPTGQVRAGVLRLPVLKEAVGFGGVAGLLEGQGADEVADPLPFLARRSGQDLVKRLPGVRRGLAGELALGGEPVFEPFVNVRGIGLAGAEPLRPFPRRADQAQRVIGCSGLEAFHSEQQGGFVEESARFRGAFGGQHV